MEQYDRRAIYDAFCEEFSDSLLQQAFLKILFYVEENNYQKEFMLKKDRYINDLRNKVRASLSSDILLAYLNSVPDRVRNDFISINFEKAKLVERLDEQVEVAREDFKGKGESAAELQSLANRRALAIERLLKVLYSVVNLDEWVYKEIEDKGSLQITDINAFMDQKWKGIVDGFFNGNSREKVASNYEEALQSYIRALNAHSHYPILEQLPLNVRNLIEYELATGKIRDSFHGDVLLEEDDFFSAPDYFLLSRDFQISDDVKNCLRDVIEHSNDYDKKRYTPGSLNGSDNDFLSEFACSVYVVLCYEMSEYKNKLGKNRNDLFKEIIEKNPSKGESLKYISDLPGDVLNNVDNNSIIIDIIDNFSVKEIQWLFETVNSDANIKLDEMVYYCIFFKKYVKSKCEEFSLNPEKYARINDLFTMISNTNDLSRTAYAISLWFSSIRLEDLSSDEIQEIEKIDNKYFMKSLTFQDKILYEKCKRFGINFEFYYKRFTVELIEYLSTLFKGMSIPLEALNYCFTTFGSRIARIEWPFKVSDLNLALFKANGPYEDIQNIISLYNSFNIPIKDIPGMAFKLSYQENYDLLKDTNGNIDLNFLNELADSKDTYGDEFSKAIVEVLKKENVLPMYYHLIINYYKTFSNCDISRIPFELTFNIGYLRNKYGLDPSQTNYPYYYLFNSSVELTTKLNYIESLHIYDMKSIPSYDILQDMNFFRSLHDRVKMNKGTFFDSLEWLYECSINDTKTLELIQEFLTTLKPNVNMLPLGINEVMRNYSLCKMYTHDVNLKPGDWLFYKDPGETKEIINMVLLRGVPFRVEFMYFDISVLRLHFKEINSKLSFLDDLGVHVMYESCEKITSKLDNSMSSVNIQSLFSESNDVISRHSRVA